MILAPLLFATLIKPAWEWTLDERLAKRYPELFLPHELFDFLMEGALNSDDTRVQSYRDNIDRP